MNFEYKLKEIMFGNEEKSLPIGNSIDKIETFEQSFSLRLPEDYRGFLMKSRGFIVADYYYVQPIEQNPWYSNGLLKIDYFYDLETDCELGNAYRTYIGRMPKELIPIAEAPGGNQICLSVSGETIGRIYFWDHESEFTSDEDLWANVSLVAESFTDLLDRFDYYKPEKKPELRESFLLRIF